MRSVFAEKVRNPQQQLAFVNAAQPLALCLLFGQISAVGEAELFGIILEKFQALLNHVTSESCR